MLEVDVPKHGLVVDISFTIDRSRPEWAVLTPPYRGALRANKTIDVNCLEDAAKCYFGEHDFPELVHPQYPNYTYAPFRPLRGYILALRLYDAYDSEVINISGSRGQIIVSLASLYPVLFLCEPAIALTQGFKDTVDAMLQFIHKDLSTTRQGVLHAVEETIINE